MTIKKQFSLDRAYLPWSSSFRTFLWCLHKIFKYKIYFSGLLFFSSSILFPFLVDPIIPPKHPISRSLTIYIFPKPIRTQLSGLFSRIRHGWSLILFWIFPSLRFCDATLLVWLFLLHIQFWSVLRFLPLFCRHSSQMNSLSLMALIHHLYADNSKSLSPPDFSLELQTWWLQLYI